MNQFLDKIPFQMTEFFSKYLYLKKVLKWLLKAIGIFFSLILFYMLFSLLFSKIPVNSDYQKLETGISIFIKSNGIHADFVLPVKNEFYDWQTHLAKEDFNGYLTEKSWIAFGWGDQAFFLDTPNWSDLNLLTATKSLLINTPSAMHVTCYPREPKVHENCHQIFITESQYQILISHIKESFIAENQRFKKIEVEGYNKNDRFFHSNYSYNLIQTCNYWVVKGMKKMGVKTSFWSPFDKGVFWHL